MTKIKKIILMILVIVFFVETTMINSDCVSAKQIYKEGFSYSKITKDIKKQITGCSYRKNKNIKLSDLRYVEVLYYNYKGNVKKGEMIVNRKIASNVVKVFYELYNIRYPIRRMKLVDEYNGDDNKSMEADNTSCFNYRPASGSKSNLSMHALGLAIDINPKINPCVGGVHGILPKNGKIYSERSVNKCKGKYKNMMIHKNDEVYRIFKKYGFSWGGDWKSLKDYQHFYKEVSGISTKLRYEW